MYRIALTAMILCLGQAGLVQAVRAQSRTIAADITQQPSAGYVIQGSFSPADATRAYWLTLAAGQSVEVTALPLGGTDPVLTVYDEAGAELATNDDFGDGLAARVPLFSAAGQRVRADGKGSTFCDSLLSATPGEMTFAINAPRLTGGVSVTPDEVLRAMRFWVPQWYKDSYTVAYYDVYDHPAELPPYALGEMDFWWYDAARADELRAAGAFGR